jgi:hypothetical protein
MNMGHHMFDNVFVNPEAYESFLQTGMWPDKTLLVLEGRQGEDKGSINKQGSYQGTVVMGVEVHVKDEARFPGSDSPDVSPGSAQEGRTCPARDGTSSHAHPSALR